MFTELQFVPNAPALRALSDLTSSMEMLSKSFLSVVPNPDMELAKDVTKLNSVEKELLSKVGANYFFYRKEALKPCLIESLAKTKDGLEAIKALVPSSEVKYNECLDKALSYANDLVAYCNVASLGQPEPEVK